MLPVTVAHLAQGAAVAAATQIVQASDHSTENTLITAVAGVLSIMAANITANWFKERRGSTDDRARAEAQRLKRENAALRRKLKAAQAKATRKEDTSA